MSTVEKLVFAVPYISEPFDLLICDEAYQVPFKDLALLLPITRQTLLVGDPGQLPPLVQTDTDRFEAARYKIHWPAPREVLRRFPNVPVVTLPATWRLPQDTVDLLQPSLYPDLSFVSAVRGRRLRFGAAGLGTSVDRALDMLAGGASIVGLILDPIEPGGGQIDTQLADAMAIVVARALERRAEWVGDRALTADDVGCLDAHVASGAAVSRYLRASRIAAGVPVATPEIWQGLQKPLIVAKHPLSGVSPFTVFDLEPGRFCVMLSRHQLGCVIVGRAGVGEALERHQHDSAGRASGAENAEWAGWRAHRELWFGLERAGRLLGVSDAELSSR